MRLTITLPLSLFTLVCGASGQRIDRPYLPKGPDFTFWNDLDRYISALPQPTWTITPWADSSVMPGECYGRAVEFGIDPLVVEVSEVKYTDCSKTWTICLTKDFRMRWKMEQIASQLAKIPVGLRQFVGELMIMPEFFIGPCGYAYTGGLVVINDKCWDTQTLVHELSHEMDHFGMGSKLDRYSIDKKWVKSQINDTHVVTEYAQNNQVENFAEVSYFAILERLAPGGVATYIDESGKAMVRNQLQSWVEDGNKVVFSGNCNAKVAGSGRVLRSNGAPATTGRFSTATLPLSEPICAGLAQSTSHKAR